MMSMADDYSVDLLPGERFADWVMRVNNQVLRSGLGVVRFAQAVNTRPAEILAVMRLATLDPADLQALDDNVPPKTTWLSFAHAESSKIREAVLAMEREAGSESRETVLRGILHVDQLEDASKAVRGLPASTLRHFVAKATAYSAFNERQAKAFKSLVSYHARGADLSEAQVEYLKGLLKILASSGAISRQSREGDQELCNQILDAIDFQ